MLLVGWQQLLAPIGRSNIVDMVQIKNIFEYEFDSIDISVIINQKGIRGKIVLLLLLVIVAAEEDRYWAVNYNITMKNTNAIWHSDTMELSEIFSDREECFNVLEIYRSKE